MSRQAKEFQEATAERIEAIFSGGRQRRVLLADEVGLGKTIMAKGVIDRVRRMRRAAHDDMYRVVYVCSNINIVQQNVRNLGMEQLNLGESRLSMQHLVIQERVAKLQKDGQYRRDGDYGDIKMPELLIPLTPATSFSLTQGCGTKNERALIYGMLQKMGMVREELKDKTNEFFRNGVNIDSWKNAANWYCERIGNCDKEYPQNIRKRLIQDCNFNSIIEEMEAYIAEGKTDRSEKMKTLGKIRMAFAQISIEELEADLIIMDEFQRFSSLIQESHNVQSEQDMITQQFFKTMDENDVKETGEKNAPPLILLLSATPYKPYTTLEELNENNIDEHYQDFLKLTDFLFTGERAKDFHTVWRDYSTQLSHLSSDSFDILLATKRKAEEEMYSAMCRTERLKESLIDTQHVREEPITEGDILSYAQMQRIMRDCEQKANEQKLPVRFRNVPTEYVKSSPYLLSFMEKYELKKYIKRVYEKSAKNNKVSFPIGAREQRVLLVSDRIYKYKKLEPNNARLTKLQDVMLNEQKRSACLLWIPASRPYYTTSPKNVFEQNRDFSKMLVFSAWEMVPRMVSFMLSYEAERQTIGKYKEGKKEASYSNKVGDNPLRKGRDLLRFYNDYLAKLYDPEAFYGKDIEEIRASIENKVENNIRELGGNVEEEYGDATSENVIDIAKRLNAKGRIDAEVNAQIIRDIANMAIASPAVVLYRRLGDEAIKSTDHTAAQMTDSKERRKEDLTERMLSLFNQRQSVGIMSQLYKNVEDYWRRVLRYCVDGNLQAVIDEYIHMIDDTGERKKEEIAAYMYESFITSSNIQVDSTKNFYDLKEKKASLRIHYAMMFANMENDERTVSRSSNVRQAFNSPFWPFALSTTSIGQEGLDFHWYCRKIMHWNIPSNPQDMEQREGRINRYKCLAIRRNIAHKYKDVFGWKGMFDKCGDELGGKYGGIVPYWCIPTEKFAEAEKMERFVPMYPLSSDVERYRRMNGVLSLYRLTLGQPRQEELAEMLQQSLNEKQTEELLFNLSPMKRKKQHDNN